MERRCDPRCWKCAFFKDDDEKRRLGNLGQCRKSEPGLNDDGEAVWPKVRGQDWCGEYQRSANQ